MAVGLGLWGRGGKSEAGEETAEEGCALWGEEGKAAENGREEAAVAAGVEEAKEEGVARAGTAFRSSCPSRILFTVCSFDLVFKMSASMAARGMSGNMVEMSSASNKRSHSACDRPREGSVFNAEA